LEVRPGKHTSNTENLPVLRSLFGIPFGGNTPSAPVWVRPQDDAAQHRLEDELHAVPRPGLSGDGPIVSRRALRLKVVDDGTLFLVKPVGSPRSLTPRNCGPFSSADGVEDEDVGALLHADEPDRRFKQISGHLETLSASSTSMVESGRPKGFSLIGFLH